MSCLVLQLYAVMPLAYKMNSTELRPTKQATQNCAKSFNCFMSEIEIYCCCLVLCFELSGIRMLSSCLKGKKEGSGYGILLLEQ